MYHPAVIARRQELLMAQPAMRQLYPTGLPEYAVPDAQAITAQILRTLDPDTGQPRRPLTAEESRFAAVASIRSIFDAPWWLEVFCWIDSEGKGIRPLYPLWESQRFVLSRLAYLEQKHLDEGSADGLLINCLKARQLGVSTLAQALIAHRIYTQPYIRAIAGSDVEEQATYLFRMN